MVNVEDVEFIEQIKVVKVKKGARPSKVARLNQLLIHVPQQPAYFLEVTAANGITPVGGSCQFQNVGAAGPDGVDGLHCWDRNSNGVCDVATEDADASGACDPLDCRGPQGTQGQDGPRGPSEVFTTAEPGPLVFPASANAFSGGAEFATPAVLAELPLPSGSYLIDAKGIFESFNCSNTSAVQCWLRANGDADSRVWLTLCSSGIPVVRSSLPHHFDVAGVAQFVCIGDFHPSVGRIEGSSIRVDAIRVDQLTSF